MPSGFVITVDPIPGEANSDWSNNTTYLGVAETGTLSFELEKTAPVANTREDRVELWLRRHSRRINLEAGRRHIDPRAIAGAIAWEAIVNVGTIKIGRQNFVLNVSS